MKYNKKILMKVEKQPILYHVRENNYPSSCVHGGFGKYREQFKEEIFYDNSAQHIRN